MTAMSRQSPGSGTGVDAELVFVAEIGQQPGISIRLIAASADRHRRAHADGVLLFERDTRSLCAGPESPLVQSLVSFFVHRWSFSAAP